jgi:hypothetical protein
MKKLLFLCICLASTFGLKAQTEDKKWNVGLHGGAIQYNGDLGRDWYKSDKAIYGFGGISVSRYLWDFIDVSASYSRGTLGYDSGETGYKSDFSAVNVNLRWNLISHDIYYLQ